MWGQSGWWRMSGVQSHRRPLQHCPHHLSCCYHSLESSKHSKIIHAYDFHTKAHLPLLQGVPWSGGHDVVEKMLCTQWMFEYCLRRDGLGGGHQWTGETAPRCAPGSQVDSAASAKLVPHSDLNISTCVCVWGVHSNLTRWNRKHQNHDYDVTK